MDWQTISTHIATYGYPAITVGTLIDHSGITLAAVVGGATARVSSSINLLGVVVSSALGSLLSDLALFALGRFRHQWVDRWAKSDRAQVRLKVLREFMKKWAFPLLVFGRFLPLIGRFVPAVAGLQHVTLAKVAFSCAAGGFCGGLFFALVGYFTADRIRSLQSYGLWIFLAMIPIAMVVIHIAAKKLHNAVERRLDEEGRKLP